MPIYEFECGKCGHQFEDICSLKDEEATVTCPRCGEHEARRRISLIAGKGACGSCTSCSSSSFS